LLQEAFRICDEDGDDYLNKEEMRRLVLAMELDSANWPQVWGKICEQVSADPYKGVDISGVAWHMGHASVSLWQAALQKLNLQAPPVIPLGDGGVCLSGRTITSGGGSRGSSPGAPAAPAAAPPPPVQAASKDPWLRLLELQGQIKELQSNVQKVEAELLAAEITPSQARDVLAQLEAQLDVIQCKGIDSVSTQGLGEHREHEARMLRKDLTRQAEALQDRFDNAFAVLKGWSSSTSQSL